ncbi:membrane protein [Lysobacter helvus]|uniref:Membrane protein n=2 Tax=Lysobacteraceae TaxID=32033 RepID=A0ABM7Q3M4_9GAMM|nr:MULTISPECIES: Mpo1-like protein [Lysobacter]BCT91893.1 membrane protein [Lysobacter caseinilyticus]BCT95046.1 membrane protein [Lysobacter helvus]
MDTPANAHGTTRDIDRWFASYSDDHRNPVNQRIHVIAVPAILWSVIALLWCVPVPENGWFKPGIVAAFAMFGALSYYLRASRRLALGMFVVFAAMGWLTHWLYSTIGARALLGLAIAVFVVAWIAQFIGHKIEGRKPSFLTDLTYLLIGPAWVVAKGYRKLGLTW